MDNYKSLHTTFTPDIPSISAYFVINVRDPLLYAMLIISCMCSMFQIPMHDLEVNCMLAITHA